MFSLRILLDSCRYTGYTVIASAPNIGTIAGGIIIYAVQVHYVHFHGHTNLKNPEATRAFSC